MATRMEVGEIKLKIMVISLERRYLSQAFPYMRFMAKGRASGMNGIAQKRL